MDKYEAGVGEALRRVTAFTETVRWVWVVNMIAMIAGLARGRYGLAALAGFSWILALTAAAAGRRAMRHLETISRPATAMRQAAWELEEEVA